MRHKQYTVAKSLVTCDQQTGLTKIAWVGMARKYKNRNKKESMHAYTLSNKKGSLGRQETIHSNL